ncbi:hypothetical protein OBBRIDRAFT_798871 [Obba rivulosa]|uniref:HCP-like protein n=1 Tax=Obba rivulosa TaxID=1052685 RepID=A0A8E2AJV0_9APHY|nr:hypothetical protein OBBRIDRAFT_798871 [Obba rivulosa]
MAEFSSLEQASPLETLVRRASSHRARNPAANLTTPPRPDGSQQAAHPPPSPLLHTQFRSSTTTVNTSFQDYDTSLGDVQSTFSWLDRDRGPQARRESHDEGESFFAQGLRAGRGQSVDVDSQYSYDIDDIAAEYRTSTETFRPGDHSRRESAAIPTVVVSPGDPGDAGVDLEDAFAAAEEAVAVSDVPPQGRMPSRVPVRAGVEMNFSRPRPGVLPLDLDGDERRQHAFAQQQRHPYSATSSAPSYDGGERSGVPPVDLDGDERTRQEFVQQQQHPYSAASSTPSYYGEEKPSVSPFDLDADERTRQAFAQQQRHSYSAVSAVSSYSGEGTPFTPSAYAELGPSSAGSQPSSSAGRGPDPSAAMSPPPRLTPGMAIPPAMMPTTKRPEPRLAPGTFIPPSPFGVQRSNTHLTAGTVVPPGPLPSGIRTAPAVQSFADAPSGPLPLPPESAPPTQPDLAPPQSLIPPPLASPVSLYSNYSFYQLPASPNGSTSMLSPRAVPSPRVPSPSAASPVGLSSRPPTPAGGVNQNPTTPQEWLQLGIQHHEANRLVESAKCFERSATLDGGCGVGMLMWGLTQRHGWGCAKSEKTGFKWLRRAAEVAVGDLEHARTGENTALIRSELVLAIYEVGQSFFRGWGVEKDKKMAVSYFRVAARLGDPDAQQELAFCLANGKGCKKDKKEAAKWYRAAVAQGASEIGLAWIYKEKYQ